MHRKHPRDSEEEEEKGHGEGAAAAAAPASAPKKKKPRGQGAMITAAQSPAQEEYLTVKAVDAHMQEAQSIIVDFVILMGGRPLLSAVEQEASPSPAAAPAGSAPLSPKARTVAQTRAAECVLNAKRIFQLVKKERVFYAGAVGKPGSGRSLLARTLLVSELQRARHHYTVVDLPAGLDAEQRAAMKNLYPTPSKAAFEYCTERTRIFGRRDGKISVKRVVCTPQQLRVRLRQYVEQAAPGADKAHAEALLLQFQQLDVSDVAVQQTYFTSEVLYEGKEDSIWADFEAAESAIRAAEQRCAWTVDPFLYSTWSYIEYLGPWDELGKNQCWLEMPGLNDPDRVRGGYMRAILSEEQGRRLQLIFLVPAMARRPTDTDLNLLKPFINRSLRRMPLVAWLYGPGIQGTDTILEMVRGQEWAGDVSRLYSAQNPAGVSGPACYFLRDCLQRAAVNSDVCSNITGLFREYVFARLIETQTLQEQPLTVFFFTPEQRQMLIDKRLWDAKADQVAGTQAIWARICHAEQYTTHRALLPVLAQLRCALQNVLHERALTLRVQNVPGFHPQHAKLLKKQLAQLPYFNSHGWRWREDELPQGVFKADDTEREELIDALIEVRREADGTQDALREQLLRTRLAALVGVTPHNYSLEPESGVTADHVRGIVSPLLARRLHRACLESVTAVTWLLRHPNEEVSHEKIRALFLELDGSVDIEADLEVLQRADDQMARADDEMADLPPQDVTVKGVGQLNDATMASIQKNVIRSVYQRCHQVGEQIIEGIVESATLLRVYRRKLWQALSSKIPKLASTIGQAADASASATAPIPASARAWAVSVLSCVDDSVRVGLLALSRAKKDVGERALLWQQKLASLNHNEYREQYKQELDAFVVDSTQKDWRTDADRIRVRAMTMLQGAFNRSGPADEGKILFSQDASFLAAPVNILTDKRNKKGAHGNLQKPPQPTAGPHTEGRFDVPPVPLQSLSSVNPATASPRLRNFIEEPWAQALPKRIFMSFADEQPESRSISIHAYDGWDSDLLAALHATKRSRHRGVSPIFIPSLGRCNKSNTFAKLRELNQERGLELKTHPETCVYLMVEPDPYEWSSYAKEFKDCPWITFVVLPAASHGVRFARACVVYLATCMRNAVRGKCDFSYFHQLDDDWLNPRVFDATCFSTSCMRPTTLFVVLAFVEHVLRRTVASNDNRPLLFEEHSDSLTAHFPDMSALLDEATVALSQGANKRAQQAKFSALFSSVESVAEMMQAADREEVDPRLAALVGALVPNFRERFLALMRQMRIKPGGACQAAVARKYITERHNDNLIKMPTDSAGAVETLASQQSVAAAAAGPPPPVQPVDHWDSVKADESARFDHRWSTDRVGLHVHFLPVYEKLQVNYLSTDEFFMADSVLFTQENTFFTSDRHFNTNVLAPRGYGGVLAFKVDLDFAKSSKGGINKFKTRKPQPPPRPLMLFASGEDEDDDEAAGEADDDEVASTASAGGPMELCSDAE